LVEVDESENETASVPQPSVMLAEKSAFTCAIFSDKNKPIHAIEISSFLKYI
jgi:hypothetical protein